MWPFRASFSAFAISFGGMIVFGLPGPRFDLACFAMFPRFWCNRLVSGPFAFPPFDGVFERANLHFVVTPLTLLVSLLDGIAFVKCFL